MVNNNLLDHTDLRYLLIDSLKAYSEDVEYIDGNNPYHFKINQKDLFILIKNVHDSGQGRSNPDECRIQIQKTSNFIEAKNSGLKVFFFGYYKKYNVFTAWDPDLQNERINKKKVISVYSRFSIQEEASEEGMSLYEDDNRQKVITFKPEYLGFYLENYETIHKSSKKTIEYLMSAYEGIGKTESDIGKEIKIGREKFTITHKEFKRDSKFRKLVARVYDYCCAVCGIQLEVVETAHIIPNAHEEGNNDPKNGICLCAIHHKAFDNALIYIKEDYSIAINEDKIDYLEKVKRDGGINKFRKLHYDKINLPSSQLYYPSKEYIKLANKIRGIS